MLVVETIARIRRDHLVHGKSIKAIARERGVSRNTVRKVLRGERIVIRQDGELITEHPRRFGRGHTAYDPWHYVPVLARKPGALRNGAPFKDWLLPAALAQVQRRLARVSDGERQMVDILNAVLSDGLEAVQAACAEALAAGVASSDVVLNILARRAVPAPAVTVTTPRALILEQAPLADCARYDRLRSLHGTL